MAHSHSIKEYPVQTAGIIVLAGLAGLGAGLLLAPRSGKDSRRTIRQKATSIASRSSVSAGQEPAVRDEQSILSKLGDAATKAKSAVKTFAKEASQKSPETPKPDENITDHIRRNGEP